MGYCSLEGAGGAVHCGLAIVENLFVVHVDRCSIELDILYTGKAWGYIGKEVGRGGGQVARNLADHADRVEEAVRRLVPRIHG
jgi:hypothetical protein